MTRWLLRKRFGLCRWSKRDLLVFFLVCAINLDVPAFLVDVHLAVPFHIHLPIDTRLLCRRTVFPARFLVRIFDDRLGFTRFENT